MNSIEGRAVVEAYVEDPTGAIRDTPAFRGPDDIRRRAGFDHEPV